VRLRPAVPDRALGVPRKGLALGQPIAHEASGAEVGREVCRAESAVEVCVGAALDPATALLRYGWRLLAPDGTPTVEEVDFAQLDVDGGLLQVVGFFRTQPAA